MYIHAMFAGSTMNCLDHVQGIWPKDGILRVEVVRKVEENYTIFHSYKKEYSDAFLFFESSLAEEVEPSEENENEQSSPGEVHHQEIAGINHTVIYLNNYSDVLNVLSGRSEVIIKSVGNIKNDDIVENNFDMKKDNSQDTAEDLNMSYARDDHNISKGHNNDAQNDSGSFLGIENASSTWSFLHGYVVVL